MQNEDYSKLMNYALRLLSKRSYTVQGLTEKLEKRALKLKIKIELEQIINQILERLKQLNYLDDLNFCGRFLEERCRLRPRGRYLISQELRKKGISKEMLDEFWESEAGQAFDELPLALQLAKSRRQPLTRDKLYRYLASRGFSMETIRAVLDKTLNPY